MGHIADSMAKQLWMSAGVAGSRACALSPPANERIGNLLDHFFGIRAVLVFSRLAVGAYQDKKPDKSDAGN